MSATQSVFDQYCETQGLKDDTVNILTKEGFNTKEDLRLLTDEEIDKLQLRMQQKLLLKDIVSALKEESALQIPNRVKRTKADDHQTDDEIRIVLFGMTGTGKSATGNTIIDPEPDITEKTSQMKVTSEDRGFKVAATEYQTKSQTTLCRHRSVKINGQNIRVVDTPGLLDNLRNEDEVANEITRCLLMTSPGPHILLFVLNIYARMTPQEFLAYDKLRKLFDSHLNRYVAVLFTRGDKLQKGETVESIIQKGKEAFEGGTHNKHGVQNFLQMILNDVGNRTILFSNKGDQETKDQQVLELLRLISVMKENNAPMPFFSDMKTQEAAGCLRDMVDKYMKDNHGVPRENAWEEVQKQIKTQNEIKIQNEIKAQNEIKTQNEIRKTRTIIGASGLAGASLGGGAAALLAVPFVLNPVGAGIAGAAALGAAAVGAAAYARNQEPGQCSVM